MKQILFVHQNFPGQYRYIARYFAAHSQWQAYAIGEKSNVTRQLAYIPKQGICLLGYEMPANPAAEAGLASEFESSAHSSAGSGSLGIATAEKWP
jgi:hypothetical protein